MHEPSHLTDGGNDAGAASRHRLGVNVQETQVFQEGVRHSRGQLLLLEEGSAQLLGQLGHTSTSKVSCWPCSRRGLRVWHRHLPVVRASCRACCSRSAPQFGGDLPSVGVYHADGTLLSLKGPIVQAAKHVLFQFCK